MNSFPTHQRLLLGLRSALESLRALCGSAEGDDVARSATAVLNELTLRLDHEFYREYLGSGLAILERAPNHADAQLHATLESASARIRSLAANAPADFAATAEGIETLRASFAAVLSRGHDASITDGSFAAQVVEWETALFARAMKYAEDAPQGLPAITAEGLQTYLRRRFPEASQVEVTAFKVLVGGFQKLTLLFETHLPILGCRSFVIRAEQPDRFALLELGAVLDEYAVLKVLWSMQLPVAEPLWLETDAAQLGRKFLVSRRAPGINHGAAVGLEKRMPTEVAKAFVTTLVRIHRVPLDGFRRELAATRMGHWLDQDSSAANTLAIVRYWKELLKVRGHSASPTLALIFDWLIRNVPREAAPLCLLHCDYAPHNVLVEGNEISAVLDWELTRVGDPAQDLAYFLQSTEGYIDRQQALQWYAEAGGPPLSDFRLRYFEVFSVLQWLVGCVSANSLYANDTAARNVWVIASNWMEMPLRLALPRLRAAMASAAAVRVD